MYEALKVKYRSPVQDYSAAVAAAGCCHVTPVCDSPSPLCDDSSSAQAHAVTKTSVTDTRVTDVTPLHTHFCVMHTPVCFKT